MTSPLLFNLAGVALFVIGLYGALTATPVIRRVLAINLMGNGVFVVLITTAYERAPGMPADPVPHALVLTGIVVAVSATALALKLVCRAHELAREAEGDAGDH